MLHALQESTPSRLTAAALAELPRYVMRVTESVLDTPLGIGFGLHLYMASTLPTSSVCSDVPCSSDSEKRYKADMFAGAGFFYQQPGLAITPAHQLTQPQVG